MRDIKELVDFKAEFKENLILRFCYFLFDIVVFKRVQLKFSDISLTFVHLGKQKNTLKR